MFAVRRPAAGGINLMFAVRRATFLAGISFLVRSSQANVEKTEFGGQGEVVLFNAPYLSIYLQSINISTPIVFNL